MALDELCTVYEHVTVAVCVGVRVCVCVCVGGRGGVGCIWPDKVHPCQYSDTMDAVQHSTQVLLNTHLITQHTYYASSRSVMKHDQTP